MRSNITSCTRNVGEKTGDDYSYDVNGNITKDYNRHMHTPANGNGAVYNLLDKPDSLVISGKATLYYYYDAGGNTLRKQVKDYTTGTTKNYLYLNGFVYLNDTLQYVQYEEGRIRYLPLTGGFVYDYYLKDHLGNVRTVLTEQRDTAFYMPASLETANLATEKLYYSGEDSGRVDKSNVTGYPTDGTTSPNDYIQQLSGSGFKIGTGIVLKVMAGDQFNIKVSSWYKKNGATPATPTSPLTALITNLINSIGGVTSATHGATIAQLQSSGVIIPAATNFYNSHNTADSTTKPKAFVNWVLLDDQFKYVASSSGFDQVGADQEFKVHVKNNMPVAKNGYLYVYVSNETPNINVFFDNLQVTHIHGPLLQEQSYYPFGLEMAGISDKALGKLDSKNKFNGGVEIEEDYGVNLYSTFYRQYDPQIGRFSGVDCQSEASIGMSVYQFGGNNPVSYNDPLGNKQTAGLYGGSNSYYNSSPFFSYMDRNGNKWHHGDGLIGTPSEGMQYQDGFGEDGFGGGGGGGSWGNNSEDESAVKILDPSKFISNLAKLIFKGYSITGFDYHFKKNGDFEVSIFDQKGNGYNVDIGIMPIVVGYTKDVDNESHFWEDLGGTVGGAVETTIGVAGEPETVGASTFLVADGADRFLSNGHNLWNDIFGKSSSHNRIPTNLGAQIGANFGASGQKWGGIIDDAATMIITGGPLQDGIHGFNDFSNLQYGQGFVDMYSAYDGLKTIKEDVSNIIGNN